LIRDLASWGWSEPPDPSIPERRFPPPFIEDIGDCFVVKASNNRPLVFIYYGEGVARLAKLLTRDAARRIAASIAARAIAEGSICLTKIKVLPSRQSLSFFGGNWVWNSRLFSHATRMGHWIDLSDQSAASAALVVIKADCLYNAGIISDGEKQWVYSRARPFLADGTLKDAAWSHLEKYPRRRAASGEGCILVTRPTKRHL
jgi:hypothetical protein